MPDNKENMQSTPDSSLPPEQLRYLQQMSMTSAIDLVINNPVERFTDEERLLIRGEMRKTVITEAQMIDLTSNITDWDWGTLQWPIEQDMSTFTHVGNTIDRNAMLLEVPPGHESEWAPNKLLLGLYGNENMVARSAKQIERTSRVALQLYFDSQLNMDPKNRQMELGMEHLGTFYSLRPIFSESLVNESQADPERTAKLKREYLVANEKSETLMHRLSKYASTIDHVFRLSGMIAVQNPILGEERVIPETVEDFMADLCTRRARKTEVGPEDLGEAATQKITVYLDKNGEQLFQDDSGRVFDQDGKEITREADGKFDPDKVREAQFHINTLDLFNTLRSGKEKRWLMSVYCALAVEDAKAGMDKFTFSKSDPKFNQAQYDELAQRVKARAQKYFNNFDRGLTGQELTDFVLAKQALSLVFAQSAQTFELGKWSLASEWSKDSSKGQDVSDTQGTQVRTFKWQAATPEFGNPTMAGDFPVGLNFFLHEFIYGLKNRLASTNNGMLALVNVERSREVIWALVSRKERDRQRQELLEKIKADKTGKYNYLVTSLGFMGIFAGVFNADDYDGPYKKVWQAANNDASEQGSGNAKGKWGEQMNPEIVKFIETKVIFLPTWVPQSEDPNDNYYFPMVLPDLEVSTLDFMSVSKTVPGIKEKVSAADLLNGTWDGNADVGFTRKSWNDGGRFLTWNDIAPLMFELHPHLDDSAAVDRKFSLQFISTLYGSASEDTKKMIAENPLQFIDLLFKAVDLGTRNQTDPDGEFKRPTREVVYMDFSLYMNAAFNVFNLIARGGEARYKNEWLVQRTVTGSDQKNPANLQTILHAMHTLVERKLSYPMYASSSRRLLLGLDKCIAGMVADADRASTKTINTINQKLGSPEGSSY